MLRFPPVLAIAGALALATSAAAQLPADTTDALTPGHRALAFNLPNGGGVGLGFWRVVAPDRARGFFVNLSTSYGHSDFGQVIGPEQSGNSLRVSASVGPQLRRYFARAAPVAPFIQSGLSLGIGYDRQTSDNQAGGTNESHSWSGSAALTAGPGVEWFPARRVSVSGQTGVGVSGTYSRSSGSSGGISQGHNSSWGVSLSTFVSSLALQIYF